MNRLKIRNRILQQLDYAPYDLSAAGFYNFVNGLINEKYLELWHGRPFLFNNKTMPIKIIPDIVGSSTATISWTKDAYFVLGNFALVEDAALYDPLRNSTIYPLILQIENEEYEVTNITDGVGSCIINLARPVREATTVASSDWKIIQRDIRLPIDCLEVLNVGWRDRVQTDLESTQGSSKGIPQRLDSYAGLDLSRTGPTPEAYVSLPYRGQEILPEDSFDNISADNLGAGAFAAGTYYFGLRWYNQRTGAMSGMNELGSLEITAPQAPADIEFTFPATYGLHWFHDFAGVVGSEVIRAVLYRGYLQDDQTIIYYPIYWDKNGVDDFPQNPVVVVAPVTLGASSTFGNAYTYPRHVDVPIQKFIRFYPRPTAAGGIPDSLGTEHALIQETAQLTFDLRYIYQPQNLANDNDVPLLPSEFHSMLVDAVLQELYIRANMLPLSEVPRKKYEEKFKKLLARYSTEGDTGVRFGSSWNTATYKRIPTITYTG